MPFFNFGCCCCGGCYPTRCCSAPQYQPTKVINEFNIQPAGRIAMLENPVVVMDFDNPIPFVMKLNRAVPMVKHFANSPDVWLEKGQYVVSFNGTLTATVNTTVAMQLRKDDVLVPESLQQSTVNANEFTNIASTEYVEVTEKESKLNLQFMGVDQATLTNTKLSVVPVYRD